MLKNDVYMSKLKKTDDNLLVRSPRTEHPKDYPAIYLSLPTTPPPSLTPTVRHAPNRLLAFPFWIVERVREKAKQNQPKL